MSLAARKYVPSLDGLRAVSILMVVVSHLDYEKVIPGAFGVTLFFFISGLLITDQLVAELRRTDTIDLPRFYLRRFLRLMPAGLAYLVVAGLLYGGNYYELFHRYDTSIPGVRHPFNIIWSLAIEEHFYLLWPALLLLLGAGRRALTAMIVVCGLSLAWRAFLFHHCFGLEPGALCGVKVQDRLYKATDARLDSMAWGALVALVAAGRHARWLEWAARSRKLQLLMMAVLASTFVMRGELFRQVPRYGLQGLALTLLVPAVILVDTPVRRLLERRAAVFIGRLSYSMYLWHWAALGVADYVYRDKSHRWQLLAVVLTAVLSLASYYLIERPMLRLRHRFGSHASAGFSTSSVAAPVDTAVSRAAAAGADR